MQKLLFIALSDSQERYYTALNKAICNKSNSNAEEDIYSGKIVRLANVPKGKTSNGKAWCNRHSIAWQEWISFKLQKEKIDQKLPIFQKLIRYFLNIEALGFFDGFRKIYDNFKPTALVIYNGAHYKQQAAIALAKTHKAKIIYHELGCLPNTTAVDNKGVNFLSSVPRDSTFYKQHYDNFKNSLIALPKKLDVRKSRTYAETNQQLPKKYIFVPFQVHDDTQVLLHSPWLSSMEALYHLLETSIEQLPNDYYFVIKEHPTDKKSYSELYTRHQKIRFANGNNTQELIVNAAAIATLNSTVGIEALLLEKPVITLGNAFYNIDGLVNACSNSEDFKAAIKQTESLEYDETIRQGFFDYLQRKHLIKGRPKTFDKQHIELMNKRIKSLLIDS